MSRRQEFHAVTCNPCFVEMMQKTDFPVTIIPILKAFHLVVLHIQSTSLNIFYKVYSYEAFSRDSGDSACTVSVEAGSLNKYLPKPMQKPCLYYTRIQTKKTLDSFDNTICFFLVIASQSKIE